MQHTCNKFLPSPHRPKSSFIATKRAIVEQFPLMKALIEQESLTKALLIRESGYNSAEIIAGITAALANMGWDFCSSEIREHFYPMCSQELNIDRPELFAEKTIGVSPKYDGIRVYIRPESAPLYSPKTNLHERIYTRNGLPLANRPLKALLSLLPGGFDGEIVGHSPKTSYAMAAKYGMAHEQKPNPAEIQYVIFNYFGDGSYAYCAKPFAQRWSAGLRVLDAAFLALEANITIARADVELLRAIVQPIQFNWYDTLDGALFYANELCKSGYEGAMITTTDSPYLFRRCKDTEPWSRKVKPFADTEGTIVDMVPAKYSAGKTIAREFWGKDKAELGALVIQSADFEERFQCGTGFSQEQRIEFWANREQMLGQTIRFRYLATGSKLRPRHPVFDVIRPKADIPLELKSGDSFELAGTIWSLIQPTNPDESEWYCKSPDAVRTYTKAEILAILACNK